MENYKHTSHYSLINGVPMSKDEDFITKAVLNSSGFIRDMIYSCDMFRLKYAEFTLIWYRGRNKARLTICKSVIR